MLGRIFNKVTGGKTEPPPPRREIKRPLTQKVSNGLNASGVVVPLGDLEKKKLNDFVSQLVDFRYLPSKIKSIADSHLGDIFAIYCDAKLANAEAEKRNRVVTPKIFKDSKSMHFGAYTLTMKILSAAIANEDVSVLGLVAEREKGFCEKLMDVTEEMVAKNNQQFHIADIRYYLYLKGHLAWVPGVMKNGKGNIFAGTIVMVGSVPHVLVATWRGMGFEEELISLRNGLEDVAQFVLIKK